MKAGRLGRARDRRPRPYGGSGSYELGDYLIGQDPSRINDLWQ